MPKLEKERQGSAIVGEDDGDELGSGYMAVNSLSRERHCWRGH